MLMAVGRARRCLLLERLRTPVGADLVDALADGRIVHQHLQAGAS